MFLESSQYERVRKEVTEWQLETFGEQSIAESNRKFKKELAELKAAHSKLALNGLVSILTLGATIVVLCMCLLSVTFLPDTLELFLLGLLFFNKSTDNFNINRESMYEEMADCYFMIMNMEGSTLRSKAQQIEEFNVFGLDVGVYIERKLIKNKRRKWEVDHEGLYSHVKTQGQQQ